MAECFSDPVLHVHTDWVDFQQVHLPSARTSTWEMGAQHAVALGRWLRTAAEALEQDRGCAPWQVPGSVHGARVVDDLGWIELGPGQRCVIEPAQARAFAHRLDPQQMPGPTRVEPFARTLHGSRPIP